MPSPPNPAPRKKKRPHGDAAPAPEQQVGSPKKAAKSRAASPEHREPDSQLREAQARLRELANPEHATACMRFFKTGKGEYAEGDQFLGLRVPDIRRVAREFRTLPMAQLEAFLSSKWHDERLFAIVVLANQFTKGDAPTRKSIYDLFCANLDHVNNWDLVDTSAPPIVGGYLADRSRQPLYALAKSKYLWRRRVAMIATLWFVRELKEYDDALAIAESLLDDSEDLIHKAVGWTLREIGERDVAVLESFLALHLDRMPRTALRYAIEKFPQPRRLAYLRGERG